MSNNVKRVTFRQYGETYHRLIFGDSLFDFHKGSPMTIEYYKPYPFLELYKMADSKFNRDHSEWFGKEDYEIFNKRIVNGKRVKVEFMEGTQANWERWRRNENWRTD